MVLTTQKSSRAGKIVQMLLLFWICLVLAHYFSWNSFSDLSFVSVVLSRLPQSNLHKLVANWLSFLKTLLTALAVLFVLWRLGAKLLGWFGAKEGNPVLNFCLQMALGIIGFNAFWLGLGFNGLWFPSLLGSLTLSLFLLFVWDLYRVGWKVQKIPRFRLPGIPYLLLGFLGIFCFLMALFMAMAPDIYFDALVYHLSTLQFWMDRHGISDFYTNLYSYYPFGGELYFLNGFYFGGSEAAKMLNAFSAGFCALAAAGWAHKESGPNHGLLTWSVVLILPLVSATVWTTQVDVLLAFFLILFFYSLWRWMEEERALPWALAAGLLGGAALTVKYTAIVGILSGLLALALVSKVAWLKKDRSGWICIIGVMSFSLIPWLIRNAAFTGNFFYPYLSHFFGGRVFSANRMSALLGDHEAVLRGDFSLLDWLKGLFSRDLDKTIGPFLFGFVPFLFLGTGKNSLVRFLGISIGLWFPLGFLISHQPRLMIPFFVLAVTAMSMVLGGVKIKGVTWVWLGMVLVFGSWSLLALCRLSVEYYQVQKMWLGEETREEYLGHMPQVVTYYGLTRGVDKSLPPESRLLIVGDARGLYYPRAVFANSPFDEQVLPKLARERKDGQGIQKGLREMGIDAMVISGDEGQRLFGKVSSYALKPEDEKKLRDFFEYWIDPIVIDGASGIYKLRSTLKDDLLAPKPLK